MATQLRTVVSTNIMTRQPSPLVKLTTTGKMFQPLHNNVVVATTCATRTTLTQTLTTPSKVAQLLDWKKSSNTVLALHVTRTSIECGIATHPRMTTTTMTGTAITPIQVLPSIPLVRNAVVKCDSSSSRSSRSGTATPTPCFHVSAVTTALQRVIHDHDVCGIVVVYPTTTTTTTTTNIDTTTTTRTNAACGRTLHVLDHVAMNTTTSLGNSGAVNSSSYSSSMKPICLYDPNSSNSTVCHNGSSSSSTSSVIDRWGRSPQYSTTTTATVVHCNTKPSTTAAATSAADGGDDDSSSSSSSSSILQHAWSSFVQHYWPNSRIPCRDAITTSPVSNNNDEEYDHGNNNEESLLDFVAKLNRNNNKAKSLSRTVSTNTTTTTTTRPSTFHHIMNHRYSNNNHIHMSNKPAALVYQSAA